jgi:hypothetical protein
MPRFIIRWLWSNEICSLLTFPVPNYGDRYVEEGASVVLDDDLILHLTKRLTQQPVCDEASSGLRADS